jgi:hypothetical protein
MKQGDEALNASSLQFSRRVYASSLHPYVFLNQRETLHRRYFLRKIVIKRFIVVTFLRRFIA